MAKSAPAASSPRRVKKLIRPAVQLELFPAYVHCSWEDIALIAAHIGLGERKEVNHGKES